MTFKEATDIVIPIEGAFANDPDDAGGITKWGIASKWHPEVLRDGFSRDDALAIYLRDYWIACRCDKFPGGLDLMVFDMAVQFAPVDSIKLLQKALGAKVDGTVGRETIALAAKCDKIATMIEITALRAVKYSESPIFQKNKLGWFRRLAKIHSRALGL